MSADATHGFQMTAWGYQNFQVLWVTTGAQEARMYNVKQDVGDARGHISIATYNTTTKHSSQVAASVATQMCCYSCVLVLCNPGIPTPPNQVDYPALATCDLISRPVTAAQATPSSVSRKNHTSMNHSLVTDHHGSGGTHDVGFFVAQRHRFSIFPWTPLPPPPLLKKANRINRLQMFICKSQPGQSMDPIIAAADVAAFRRNSVVNHRWGEKKPMYHGSG